MIVIVIKSDDSSDDYDKCFACWVVWLEFGTKLSLLSVLQEEELMLVVVMITIMIIRLKELVLQYTYTYKLERFACEVVLVLQFRSSWYIRPFRKCRYRRHLLTNVIL